MWVGSYPIPCAIRSRIASDWAGRPVPPQTAFGLAQDDDTLGAGASTPPAGRSGTTGSQPDDRQQFQLSTGNRPQSDVEQGSGRIWQRCTSMPLECTPAAGGQRGKP